MEGIRQFLGPEQIPLDRFDAGEDAKAPEDMEDHRRQQPAEDTRRVAAWLFALNGVAKIVEGAVAANDNSLVSRRHGSAHVGAYNEMCITLSGKSGKAREKSFSKVHILYNSHFRGCLNLLRLA